MFVRHIMTKLEHELRGKKQIGSFLRLEQLEAWELTDLRKLAETKLFDPRSRANLESIQPGQENLLEWYLSIDGNYIVVDRDEGPIFGEQCEYLNFFVEGTLSDILKRIRDRIQDDRDLTKRVFKHAGLSAGKLPKRFNLPQLGEVNLEDIRHRIRNVDPIGSPDDILAYAIIAGREKDEWGKDTLAMCKKEASNRFAKNDFEHSDSIFPLNQVSVDELEARNIRGMETLAKFNNKFPAAGCLENRIVNYDEWNWNVREFLGGLTDDMLAELLLVFFSGSIEPSERSKVLFGEASERIHRHFN